MNKYKICCVTYLSLDDLVRDTVSQIEDPELEIELVSGLRERVLPEIEKKIALGTEIILAGGANAKIIKDFCNIPVLDYQINSVDYLLAVSNSQKIGKRIAIVTYREPISQELIRYLNAAQIMVENIIYEDTWDLMNQLTPERFDVVIGGAHAVEMAEKTGIKSMSIFELQSGWNHFNGCQWMYSGFQRKYKEISSGESEGDKRRISSDCAAGRASGGVC
ncbi:MAG: PrpR N-terminal domain-containing protein [Lachnospiraceae bacterium]|nr:PrpR N-terminal domain-containing protein [Lachnospiraceae bacterium]